MIKRFIPSTRIVMTFVLLLAVFLSAAAEERETPQQKDHRAKRIQYLNQRKVRYQNVVDTNIFKLTTLYLEDKEFQKALSVLRTAATKSPDEQSRWTAYFIIGDIERMEFDNPIGAIQAFERVQGVFQPLAYTGLIDLYGQQGLQEEFKNNALLNLDRFQRISSNKKSRWEREHDLERILWHKIKIFSKYREREKALQACRTLADSVKDSGIKNKALQEIKRLESGR